jgi:serine/threonine protein kinase
MPLDPNNDLLRTTLEALPELEGRFRNLQLVNWNPAMPQKRGSFSLVFRADDSVDHRSVAIKFYDISPAALVDRYRQAAFARECDILHQLLAQPRCLQLVRGLSTYQLPVTMPGGVVIILPCQYFAVEWLDDDIDHYFLDPKSTKYSAVHKLKLFNKIVLAVEALHRKEIFHRDLKVDNLRACQRSGEQVVVAIDLGTAARMTSSRIIAGYPAQVGAIQYAAPEAICGLAGNRHVALYTDLYALGCLLFELYNQDLFFKRLYALNPGFQMRLAAMSIRVSRAASEDQQMKEWHSALQAFGAGVAPVAIDAPGSLVPPGVVPQLNQLVAELTCFDYRKRLRDLVLLRAKVWTAIHVLENQQAYNKRLTNVRELRRRRRQRALELDARFNRRKKLPSPSC